MDIKTITNCPTCGAGCRVDGDDKEGTHYYVPIVSQGIIKAAGDLIAHLELVLGDIKLSGTYHLKERLKKALSEEKQ